MMRTSTMPRDLMVTMVLATLGALFVLGGAVGWVRVAATLPLAVAIPGYSVMRAITAGSMLGFSQRAVLTLGLNLVVVIMTGVVLNLTVFGLSPISWAITLAAISLVSCWIAGYRLEGIVESNAVLVTPQRAIFFALMIAACVAVVGVSRQGASTDPAADSPALWALASETRLITVGLRNDGEPLRRYRIQMTVGDRELASWSEVTLAEGEQWLASVPIPEDVPPGSMVVTRAEGFTPDGSRSQISREVRVRLDAQ